MLRSNIAHTLVTPILLSLMPFVAEAQSSSSAYRLADNKVIYLANSDVEDSVVTVARVEKMMSSLGMPYTGSDGSSAASICITTDYYDAETGLHFPAGYYRAHQSGTSRSYFGGNGIGGLQNLRKIIYYFATSYDPQFSTYLVDDNGSRYSLDPNNKFIITSPGFKYSPTMLQNGEPTYESSGRYFQVDKPLKFTLDFTEGGDPLNAFDGKLSGINSDTTFYYAMYRRILDAEGKAEADENGKEIPGERILWSPDNIFQTGYKRPSALLAVAFICGDDDAPVRYASIADQGKTSNARWYDTDPGPSFTPLRANEQAAGYFFSDRCSITLLDYIKETTGYDLNMRDTTEIAGVLTLKENLNLYTVIDTLSTLSTRNISMALGKLSLPCTFSGVANTAVTAISQPYTDTETGITLPSGYYRCHYPSTLYFCQWGSSTHLPRTGVRNLRRMTFYMSRPESQLELKVIEVGIDSTQTERLNTIVTASDDTDGRRIILDLQSLTGWSADKIYLVSYRATDANTGIMAISWLSATDAASTLYGNLSEYVKSKTASWAASPTEPMHYTAPLPDAILSPQLPSATTTSATPRYNLSGQRVGSSYRGITIERGVKKMQ